MALLKNKNKNPTNWAQRDFPAWSLDHKASHQVTYEVPGFTVGPWNWLVKERGSVASSWVPPPQWLLSTFLSAGAQAPALDRTVRAEVGSTTPLQPIPGGLCPIPWHRRCLEMLPTPPSAQVAQVTKSSPSHPQGRCESRWPAGTTIPSQSLLKYSLGLGPL